MTQSGQLPLALGWPDTARLEDFIVGRNAAVLDALREALGTAGERLLYLFGPRGCGRSLLLTGQCTAGEALGLNCAYVPLASDDKLAPAVLDGLDQYDVVAIDDVHAVAGHTAWEAALFTLFNRVRDNGALLLFSADRGPAALQIGLPDLASRLTWGLTLPVSPLDDDGRLELMKQTAEHRALALPDDVARYLLARAPRHPRELVALVERLDRASLVTQRRLTIPFVREYLDGASAKP